MSEQYGLYSKYNITKADTGEPIEGFAFVLKPESDWRAAVALAFYASLTEQRNPVLASDLRRFVGEMIEPITALRQLAAYLEDEADSWSNQSESYHLMGDAYKYSAKQLRGLLYEIENPAPTGPWDNLGHMQSELAGWREDHPLTKFDSEGNESGSPSFYRPTSG